MKRKEKQKKQFNKKSQSNIIVTVLLILIGIAAVAILAVWIVGFVRTNSALDNAFIELSISPSDSFNAQSYMGSPGFIEPTTFIKVSRGSGNVNLVGIKFIFYNDGSATVYTLNSELPGELEYRTYYLPHSSVEEYPDSVEIAPIILINGKEKVLPVVSKTELITRSGQYDKNNAKALITETPPLNPF